jgi:chemotaxis response regulator CheB
MRIAIVNDMPMAAETLRRAIAGTAEHAVAWIAANGAEAVDACKRDLPDLILMDLLMPVMDGVEATRRIMQKTPCAILVVTSSVTGNYAKAFEAMGAGAIDLTETPAAGRGAAALLYKIGSIAKLIGKTTAPQQPVEPQAAKKSERGTPLVAIGASAGGPPALARILGALPAEFPAGVVIVQHVDPQFVAGLADWLRRATQLSLRVAEPGDTVEPGTVLLAAGAQHLVFTDPQRLGYTAHPADAIYRPSIDVFFESVVRHRRGSGTGVLLTGMGRDGAAGLKQLRTAGFHTIGQDRATSAVYGMPKAAAELGAVAETLPLSLIAPALVQRHPAYTPTPLPS